MYVTHARLTTYAVLTVHGGEVRSTRGALKKCSRRKARPTEQSSSITPCELTKVARASSATMQTVSIYDVSLSYIVLL